MPTKYSPLRPCTCGCGRLTRGKYIREHIPGNAHCETKRNVCSCGCGQKTHGRHVAGHGSRPLAAWHRLEARMIPEANTGCWLMTSVINCGYSTIQINGRETLAHRAAYELLKGPIPEGLELHHVCRTKSCINPDHLEVVTRDEHCLRHKREECRSTS